MTEWQAVAILPNIQVIDPIEAKWIALVGHEDERLKALRCASPNLNRLLSRFTDAFGSKISPAVIIQKAAAPEWVRIIEYIASFRDSVAIATIVYNRAIEIESRRGDRITYSNSFWMYPCIFNRNDEYMTINTPALLGLHDVSKFRGQSAPEMPYLTLSSRDIDGPLLSALLKRLPRRYGNRRASWADRALFRSLNMAYHAAQIPAGVDTTFYDVGRMIALWISAFEILAHPGKGKSGLDAAYRLLDQVEWISPKSGAKRYRTYPRKANSARRTAACWLYGELHRARNDFLHGNKVTPARLRVRDGINLFQLAAPLYRLALAGFLSLHPSHVRLPPISRRETFSARLAELMKLRDRQYVAEKAILLARGIAPRVRARSGRQAALECAT